MSQEQLDSPLYAPDFELPGIDGNVHHLSRYLEQSQAVAVIFMCNSCPTVQQYLQRLETLQTDFYSQGFTLIGINANDSEQSPENSFENMKKFAAKWELNFPYLWDPSQDVAHGFEAKMTPEAFLIDKKAVIRYRGAIDDSPQSAEAVEKSYLRDAIASLLKGEKISVIRSEPFGSPLRWRRSG
ncbi:MAG: thioredoxin family protein [Chroococcales cyanobacterium]